MTDEEIFRALCVPKNRRLRGFLKYHRDNPRIYKLVLRFTKQVKEAGFTRYSIWPIIGRIRWHVYIETRSSDGFKISNNQTPYYSRLLMYREKDLRGFFKIHILKGQSADEHQLALYKLGFLD